jgi:hypothetical protein
MWLARRSADKAINPGKLDNLVGGGDRRGCVAPGNARQGSMGGSRHPARARTRARLLRDTVHIWREQPDGLQSETIYVHDLWLPSDFVPANQDGEAATIAWSRFPRSRVSLVWPPGPDEVTADASLVSARLPAAARRRSTRLAVASRFATIAALLRRLRAAREPDATCLIPISASVSRMALTAWRISVRPDRADAADAKGLELRQLARIQDEAFVAHGS